MGNREFVDAPTICPATRHEEIDPGGWLNREQGRGRRLLTAAAALVMVATIGLTACGGTGSETALKGVWHSADQSGRAKFCSESNAVTAAGGDPGGESSAEVLPSLACSGKATWYDVEEFRVAADATVRFSVSDDDGASANCVGRVASGDQIDLKSDACSDSSGKVPSDFGTVRYRLTDGCLTTTSPAVTRNFVRGDGSCAGQEVDESVHRVPSPTGQTDRKSAPPSIARDLASVPLAAIAAATVAGAPMNPVKPIPGGTSLKKAGKPEVLYMGGEFCPYCAAERWALTVALSKFGTFSGLGLIRSAESDVPTLTYAGATYTSKYLTFTPVEVKGNRSEGSGWVDLERATDDQMKLLTKLGGGSFPFIDFGGKHMQSGGSVDAQVFIGKTQVAIAATLAASSAKDTDPSTLAGSVNQTAGEFISVICHLTGDRPADVCAAIPSR